MEIHEKITEIIDFVESARSMPMSSSALLNKPEMLRLLDELREVLPENLNAADAVLAKREAILAEARGNAERLIEQGRAEQARLVADHAVLAVARDDAHRVRTEAQDAAAAAKRDVDDHIDAKLAHLELAAERIVETAREGREKLRRTTPYDELAVDRTPELTEAAGAGDTDPDDVVGGAVSGGRGESGSSIGDLAGETTNGRPSGTTSGSTGGIPGRASGTDAGPVGGSGAGSVSGTASGTASDASASDASASDASAKLGSRGAI